MQMAFKKAGIANPLFVARDGEEAVAYLSGEGEYADRERFPLPVILLLDLKMPRRSGFSVLKWMREQPDLKHMPVVVLTASDQAADIRMAYELGANSYLLKPVNFDALYEMVKTLKLYWLVLNQKPQIRMIVNQAVPA
jgi:DNA-binding response OmpR family regulator